VKVIYSLDEWEPWVKKWEDFETFGHPSVEIPDELYAEYVKTREAARAAEDALLDIIRKEAI